MFPIRLTATAFALGAATFFVATLVFDGPPPPAADLEATTAAADRAAFVARVAAGLEDEPHARGWAPAAEAQAEAPRPAAAPERALAAGDADPVPEAAAEAAPREPAHGVREARARSDRPGWIAASGPVTPTPAPRPMPRHR